MATINDIIAEARYDLRDTDSTLYTDAELLYYGNRGLKQLDNVLSARNSDWVFNEDSLTLVSGNNYVASPSRSMVVRDAWISSTQLSKKSPAYIYRERKFISATGQPYHFAEVGTNLQFERTADEDYTVKVYYDKRALLSAGDMPYDGEFNDPIREMIVILAHKRQEEDVLTDTQIFNYFMEQVGGNILRRQNVARSNKLDF